MVHLTSKSWSFTIVLVGIKPLREKGLLMEKKSSRFLTNLIPNVIWRVIEHRVCDKKTLGCIVNQPHLSLSVSLECHLLKIRKDRFAVVCQKYIPRQILCLRS